MMMIKENLVCFLLASIVLNLVVSSCKNNNPVGDVVHQYREGEISEDSLLDFVFDSININATLEWANKHKDDDMANLILGRAYKEGLVVPKNVKISKAYYLKSIDKGNVRSMQDLACLYVECADMDSSYYWFKKASQNGLWDSYLGLAVASQNIRKMKKLPIDTAQYLNYILRGYGRGSVSCTIELARLYNLNGSGVEKDSKKAYELLMSLPDSKLNDFALYQLGEMFENGDGASQSFNKAFRYYKRSADKGNTNAICKVGNFYQFGYSVEKCDSIAFIYYNKAANNGNSWGQRCVAICYNNGCGVKQNKNTAIYWWKSAAKNGDQEAIKYCEEYEIEY